MTEGETLIITEVQGAKVLTVHTVVDVNTFSLKKIKTHEKFKMNKNLICLNILLANMASISRTEMMSSLVEQCFIQILWKIVKTI